MSCRGGDRDGERALDCSDRNRRRLAGSPAHEGTNLIRQMLFPKLAERHVESIGR
jgi:hypothetical protein